MVGSTTVAITAPGTLASASTASPRWPRTSADGPRGQAHLPEAAELVLRRAHRAPPGRGSPSLNRELRGVLVESCELAGPEWGVDMELGLGKPRGRAGGSRLRLRTPS